MSGVLWVLVAVAAVVLVAAAAVPLSRGVRRRRELAGARQRARAEHTQLGSYVQTVSPGDDERAAALLRSARERWRTTGSLPASARSVEEITVAEQTVSEGMSLVAQACERLGVTAPEL